MAWTLHAVELHHLRIANFRHRAFHLAKKNCDGNAASVNSELSQ